MNRSLTQILFALLHLTLLISELSLAQQSRFDEANELMDEQRVAEALDMYRSIEQDGYRSGRLYFNMGMAALYQDSLGLAKFYMMQSEQFKETARPAGDALQMINNRFERRSAVLPPLPWERFTAWVESQFSDTQLMIFSLILLNVAAGAVIGSWFTRKGVRLFRYGSIVAAVLSLLLMALAFTLQYMDRRYATGVMVERQTTVHERPDPNSASVSTAYEGYTMRVDLKLSEQPETGDWSRVRLQNGVYGWVQSKPLRHF